MSAPIPAHIAHTLPPLNISVVRSPEAQTARAEEGPETNTTRTQLGAEKSEAKVSAKTPPPPPDVSPGNNRLPLADMEPEPEAMRPSTVSGAVVEGLLNSPRGYPWCTRGILAGNSKLRRRYTCFREEVHSSFLGTPFVFSCTRCNGGKRRCTGSLMPIG